MAGDFLDQFVDKSNAGESDADDIDDRQYHAFKIGLRTVECELRTVYPVQHGLPYGYQYSVIAFSGDYSFFWVITSCFLVKVRGHKLRPVVRALRDRKAAYLQEFDERKHDIPTDETKPVITQMDVIIQPANESYREASEKYGPQAAKPREAPAI